MARVGIRAIIETWKARGGNYSEEVRRLEIDLRTAKRWVERERRSWGYVRWQGVMRRSTAPRRPKRVLRGEATIQVKAWREATGFCREKLVVLARGQGLKVSPSAPMPSPFPWTVFRLNGKQL